MSGSVEAERVGTKFGTWTLKLVAIGGFVYLFAPIVWIVVFSFNDPGQKFNLAWREFTLDNWAHPFSDTELTTAFWQSLKISFIAVTLATFMGAMMSLSLARYRFKGSAFVDVLLVIPLTTPEIVMGSSLFTLFLQRNVQLGQSTIIIAHTLFCLSFVAMTIKARIAGFDWTLEEAAADLGANPWRTFRTVTFPLILPGILAAALLSFALSIDDYIITSFTAGQTRTFPLQVWDRFKVSFLPNINVFATMILIASVALLVAISLRERQAHTVD